MAVKLCVLDCIVAEARVTKLLFSCGFPGTHISLTPFPKVWAKVDLSVHRRIFGELRSIKVQVRFEGLLRSGRTAIGFDGAHRNEFAFFAEGALRRVDVEAFEDFFFPYFGLGLLPLRLIKVLFSPIKQGGFVSARENAVMSDSDKAGRKDVEGKTPEELLWIELHEFDLIGVAVILPLEGDFAVGGNVLDSVVGNSNFMSVPPQVFHHLLRAGKRSFGIHHPWFVKQDFSHILRDIYRSLSQTGNILGSKDPG